MTGDKAIKGDRPKTISTPPSNLFDLPPSPPPTDIKVQDSTNIPVLNPFQLSFLRALNVPPSSQLHLSFTISKGAYARATKQLAASEPAVWAYVQDKLRCVSRYFSTIQHNRLTLRIQARPNKRLPYHLPHAHSRPRIRFSQSRRHHPRSPTPYPILPFNKLRYKTPHPSNNEFRFSSCQVHENLAS